MVSRSEDSQTKLPAFSLLDHGLIGLWVCWVSDSHGQFPQLPVLLLLPRHGAPTPHAPLHLRLIAAIEQRRPYPFHGMSKEWVVGRALPHVLFDLRRLLLPVYPMILRRIDEAAYVFIYPPWSCNNSFFCDDELSEPGD